MSNVMIHQVVLSDYSFLDINLPDATKTIHYYSNNAVYKIWHKEIIEKFLKENFDKSVFNAYESIKPYSYKVDLVKYCLLYVYGGWYIDLTNRFVTNIPDLLDTDLLLFYDIPGIAEDAIQTSFMYGKAGNEVFKKAIDICIENIQNKFYGKTWHYPTGPAVAGKALVECGIKDNYILGNFIPNNEDSFDFTMPDGTIIAKYKNKNLGGNPGIIGSNHYAEMWTNKDIYV